MHVESPAKPDTDASQPAPPPAGSAASLPDARPPQPERVTGGPPDWIAAGAGILGAGLGLAALAGWHFDFAALRQIHPGFPPMGYDSAISFVALGAAFGALSYGRVRLARIGAGVALLIAAIRLLQYGTGLPARTVAMAPNTGIAFIVIAMAVWCSAPRPSRRKRWVAALCGTAGAALGLDALWGYLTGLETYASANFNPMEAQTAAGLVLLGSLAVAAGWPRGREAHEDWRWFGAALAGIAGSMTAVSFWRALAALEQSQLGSAVRFRSGLPEGVLVFGLLVTVLLGIAAYLAQTARLRAVLSDRLRAEAEAALQALEGSERRYRTLLETLPQKIAYKDRESVYISCNENYARDLNVPPDSIAGRTDYEFYPPELAEKYRADDRRVMESGAIAEFEEEYLFHGERRWVQTVKTPVRNERGAVAGVIVIFWDITDRKRAQRELANTMEALQAERQRFSDVLDLLPAYVILLSPDYRVPFANRFFRERFGEARGRRCFEYLFGRSEPCEICETYNVLKTGGTHRWEWTGPDGRHYDIYDFPFTDADGSSLILEMGLDITERKQAEAALRQSEAELKESQRVARLASWSLDLKSGTLLWSDELYRMLGLNPSLPAVPYAEQSRMFTAESWGRLQAELDATVRTGVPYELELETVRADGTTGWMLARGERVCDAGGEPAALRGVALDITERKKAERALQESEAAFRTLANAMPQMVWACLPDGMNVYFSRQWVDYTGLTLEESYGKGWNIPFHPDDKQAAWEAWNHAIATGETYRIESRLRAADGSYRWFLMRGVPLRGAAGEIVKWFGTCTDIDDLKRAEQQLGRASAYNRSLLEASLDPLVTIAPDGRITDVNRAAELVTGCARQELIGADFSDSFTEPEKAREGYQRVFRDGLVRDYELAIRRRDGHVTPVLYNASVFREPSGAVAGVFAAARDITEQKRAEQALDKKAQDLARSNADLEQFAYVASHDLQEPLRMVANFTQLLADRYRDRLDEDGVEFIEYAVDGATRMQRLIQDLLTYSRVGTRGKTFEPTDCNEVLGAAVANLQLAIEESGAVVTHEELPTVTADASQMGQLFQNLVGNAIKFRGGAPPRVHVSARRQPFRWLFAVRDNGIGIDPAFADRIFVIFQRLHNRGEYPGTGIGLALCKRIVERHGGKIWVESQPGRGATFFFTIPELQEES